MGINYLRPPELEPPPRELELLLPPEEDLELEELLDELDGALYELLLLLLVLGVYEEDGVVLLVELEELPLLDERTVD